MALSLSEYFSRWFLAVVVWHSGPLCAIYLSESDNHNMCGDLSDTVTGPLYLASPSLFNASVSSVSTKCRCEVHADSFLQMEILFADVSVSRFTISCGQWNTSEDSFSTNVTNSMLPIPQDSSDCVLEVDESLNGNTSDPVHKVWIKINGSSLTFRCNNDTSSSSLTPPNTETSKADDSRSSSASSSSSSSQTTTASTFVTATSSSQTSSVQTQEDTISTSSLTTSQTDSTAPSSQATAAPPVVPDTSSSQTSSLQTPQDTITTSSGTTAPAYNSYTSDQAEIKAYLLRIIYIIVGVAGGLLLIIIVIMVVVLLRQKRRTTKYTSKTEASSDEKLTEAPGETGFINYEGVDLEENIQQPRHSHSVDNQRTFLEKHSSTGIQGQDDKQGILIENVAYQSVVDELATLHDDVIRGKHKKSEPHGGFNKLPDFMNQSTSVTKKHEDRDDSSDDEGVMMFDKPHDGFSKLPETTIKSTSVKKKLEDRDDVSDDDGMVMFDNVAYESFGSRSDKKTSDRTSKEVDSSETDPLGPKPESKLRTTNSDAKQSLPLPAGNDVWTKRQEDRGDDADDVEGIIINDTYVSAGS